MASAGGNGTRVRMIAFRYELSPSGTIGVGGVDTPVVLPRDIALILLAPGNEKEVMLLVMTCARFDVGVPVG